MRMARTGMWLGAVAILAAAWAAEQVTYLTDDPYDRDVVMIVSDAPLEYMVTRTQEVRGTVRVNPKNLLDDPVARFEIDTAKLSTGHPLRDRHMRGADWLAVDEHPQITFELTEIKSPTQPVGLKAGQTMPLDVVGALAIRGETADVPASLKVTYLPADEETAAKLPGDLLKIEAEFDFLLSDFGIEIPPRAFRKVANRQHVTVRLFASTERLVPDHD